MYKNYFEYMSKYPHDCVIHPCVLFFCRKFLRLITVSKLKLKKCAIE
jgi:hypothetical protein